MARKPVAKTHPAAFAALLAGHLAAGTRPATSKGEPWTDAAFAREVPSPRNNRDYVSDRTVSTWRKGTSLPSEIEPILRALFGPPSARHAEAREALRLAFQAAWREKREGLIDPAGPKWAPGADELTIDKTSRATDKRAAADPLRQQLQTAIRDMAAQLAEPAKRLANSRIWARLPRVVADFLAVVNCDPLEMPNRLGQAYALMTQLGQFLETDIRVQRDSAAMDDPLDPIYTVY